ncbi:MAG: leucine-rich repeat protein [Bacteroidaceae bacterium]|nr:leucine-rich repeat protein [Bacteroidaceae bacterium]
MRKLLLALMLTLFAISGVQAEPYGVIDKLSWKVDTETGVLTFTHINANNITIPGVEAGYHWKAYSKYITTVVFGDGIAEVAPNALNDLNVVSIVIFDNDKNGKTPIPDIDPDNFKDTDLDNITIVVPKNASDSDNLKNFFGKDFTDKMVIGDGDSIKIAKCGDRLNYMLTGNTLRITGEGAMYDYTEAAVAPWGTTVQALEIGNKATSIGSYAFKGCTALEAIELSNAIESIGENAFSGCTGLTTVTLNSNAAIGANAIPSTATTHFILNDKQQLLLNNNSYNQVSYVRTYNNTNWQALYLPYEISYEDWSKNFDVARINNVHQYDDDEDGNTDRTTIEIIYLKSGSLRANMPYFIKAKTTGSITLTVSDKTVNPIDAKSEYCASFTDIYTFVGTYKGISGQVMMNNNYYGMSGGSLVSVTNPDYGLGAMRWYLQIKDKYAAQSIRPRNIEIKEIGGTTNIQDITNEENKNGIYYDLSGRPIENPTRGIYILNNKKVFIK